MEYKALRKSLSSIISSLRTAGCKEELRIKFIELDWVGPTVNLCESELVLLVLNRVQLHSHIFYDFVKLLQGISGMSSTVTLLFAKLND